MMSYLSNHFLIRITTGNSINRFLKNVCINQLKNNDSKIFFDSMIILVFGKIKVAKEEFYGAKKTKKIQDIGVDNAVVSKLIDTSNNSKYLIGYLDEIIRTSVLILPKLSGYVKFSKKEGDKNKNNDNN